MATTGSACYDRSVTTTEKQGPSGASPPPMLADIIRERSSEILASWIVRFERSPLRFRRATKAATHHAQVANLVETLGVAVASAELRPGTVATRELERNAAFLGAQFASEGATGFDIAALLLELRDVVASMASAPDTIELTRSSRSMRSPHPACSRYASARPSNSSSARR